MSARLVWFIGITAAVVLIVVAIWFFYPRPVRPAAPMPASAQEKQQRFREAMQKSLQQTTSTPLAPR